MEYISSFFTSSTEEPTKASVVETKIYEEEGNSPETVKYIELLCECYVGVQDKHNKETTFDKYDLVGTSKLVKMDAEVSNTNVTGFKVSTTESTPIEWKEVMQHNCMGRWGGIQEVDCKFAKCKMVTRATKYDNVPKFEEYGFEKEDNLVFSEFALNVPAELIDNVTIEIGRQQIERIYGEIFEVLYDLYELPKTNEDGDTVIPFYLSKCGVEKLQYHNIEITVKLKEKIGNNKFYIKYKVQKTTSKHKKEILLYQVHGPGLYRNCGKRMIFNHPVGYIIYMTDQNELELIINSLKDILKLKRVKKYVTASSTISLFAFADNLTDFDHFINFSRIDSSLINNYKDSTMYYCINTQPLRIMGGMAGLKFSK